VRRSLRLASLFIAFAAGPALAAIEPIVPPSGQYLTPMSLPILPKVIGWVPNPSASLLQHARVLLPPGKTLDNTDVIISAVAYDKNALINAPSFDDFIRLVQANDRQSDPGRTTATAPALSDKAGRPLRVYTFKNSDGAPGEVAYGTEITGGTIYYTAFTVSARNAVALSNSLASFRDMLANYQ
jgi:hypothetical protein